MRDKTGVARHNVKLMRISVSLAVGCLFISILTGCQTTVPLTPTEAETSGTSPILVLGDTQEHWNWGLPHAFLGGLVDRIVASVTIRPAHHSLFGRQTFRYVINQEKELPILHLGDLLDHSCHIEYQPYAALFERLTATKRPWALAVGNHDGMFNGVLNPADSRTKWGLSRFGWQLQCMSPAQYRRIRGPEEYILRRDDNFTSEITPQDKTTIAERGEQDQPDANQPGDGAAVSTSELWEKGVHGRGDAYCYERLLSVVGYDEEKIRFVLKGNTSLIRDLRGCLQRLRLQHVPDEARKKKEPVSSDFPITAEEANWLKTHLSKDELVQHYYGLVTGHKNFADAGSLHLPEQPGKNKFIESIEGKIVRRQANCQSSSCPQFTKSFLIQLLRLPSDTERSGDLTFKILLLDTSNLSFEPGWFSSFAGRSPGGTGYIENEQLMLAEKISKRESSSVLIFAGHHDWSHLHKNVRNRLSALMRDRKHPAIYLSAHTHTTDFGRSMISDKGWHSRN